MRSVTLNIRDTKVEKEQIISQEDFRRVIDAIVAVGRTEPNHSYNQFNYQAYAIALNIGWYTGLRVSEVFGLKKDELYTVEKMKTDASKAIIPMAYPLSEILRKWFNINLYEWVVVDIEGKHPPLG